MPVHLLTTFDAMKLGMHRQMAMKARRENCVEYSNYSWNRSHLGSHESNFFFQMFVTWLVMSI